MSHKARPIDKFSVGLPFYSLCKGACSHWEKFIEVSKYGTIWKGKVCVLVFDDITFKCP